VAAQPDFDPLMLRALIALSVVVFAALVVFCVGYAKLYRIPSAAMEPTLRCAEPGVGCSAKASDRVLAIRLRWPFRGVHRGDIVAFHIPPRAAATCGASGVFVKRVIGLPGETFAERKGVVYVDGRRLVERYVKFREHQTVRPRRVPSGSYFLLGDARPQSCDSRVFGPVPRRDLIARVVATYWPPTRIVVR
jgi:signal peptidase I